MHIEQAAAKGKRPDHSYDEYTGDDAKQTTVEPRSSDCAALQGVGVAKDDHKTGKAFVNGALDRALDAIIDQFGVVHGGVAVVVVCLVVLQPTDATSRAPRLPEPRGLRGERAFEFIGDDEDAEEH